MNDHSLNIRIFHIHSVSYSNIECIPGGVARLGVDGGVEARVVVGVAEHDGLLGLRHVAADARAEGHHHVLRVGATQGALQAFGEREGGGIKGLNPIGPARDNTLVNVYVLVFRQKIDFVIAQEVICHLKI